MWCKGITSLFQSEDRGSIPRTRTVLDCIYVKDYKAEYRLRMRARCLSYLGGRCAKCGTKVDLQFDHIILGTKAFEISTAIRDGYAWARVQPELDKCQLLCWQHHIGKTAMERSVPHGGGKSGKKNCPCGPCRARKREYMRDYRSRNAVVAQSG